MFFVKYPDATSSSIKMNQNERCVKFLTFCAFFVVVLIGVMLFLAITTEFSEQKTVYYLIVAFGFISLGIIIGFAVWQYLQLKERRSRAELFRMNQYSSRQFMNHLNSTQSLNAMQLRPMPQLQLQNYTSQPFRYPKRNFSRWYLFTSASLIAFYIYPIRIFLNQIKSICYLYLFL